MWHPERLPAPPRSHRVSPVPTVRPATDADAPAIGRVLADAFETDPVWKWLVPPDVDWSNRAAAWFEADARARLSGHGEVLVDDEVRGCAMWAPPGHWKPTIGEAAKVVLPSARLFRRKLPRAIRNLATIEKRHPSDPPHWYLAILGTDPEHQGGGVGSALIEAVTTRCDEQGLGAYLESSKEQNVPFYARHGFAVREELTLPGGPTMWLMWRDPKG